MARFYGLKIKNGDMTFEQVPRLWKRATQEWLDKNGTTSGLL